MPSARAVVERLRVPRDGENIAHAGRSSGMDPGSTTRAAAADLLARFGLPAYAYALEAALHAERDGDRSEARAWFDVADAVETLLLKD